MGSHAAKLLHESDFKVTAISDVSGGYYAADGLDIPAALSYTIQHGSLEGYDQATAISNEELLALDVNVLIPAALGGVITLENANDIRAEVIVEAANGPVHPGADEILQKKGTLLLPDILANAGGVTVSYFEWVQNLQYYKWGLNRVRQELDSVLTRAFEDVWQMASDKNVSLRTAAYMIALGRVYRAAELSGF